MPLIWVFNISPLLLCHIWQMVYHCPWKRPSDNNLRVCSVWFPSEECLFHFFVRLEQTLPLYLLLSAAIKVWAIYLAEVISPFLWCRFYCLMRLHVNMDVCILYINMCALQGLLIVLGELSELLVILTITYSLRDKSARKCLLTIKLQLMLLNEFRYNYLGWFGYPY